MLKVNEIFYSIQGESTYAGLPCVFIRLTGCNLRCNYCDTSYAFEQGDDLTFDEIQRKVNEYNCSLIEITGGEPLLQAGVRDLIEKFIAQQKMVLVETNGTQNIDMVPEPAIRIMDIKCPGSGEAGQTDWNNIDRLRAKDNVKFIVSNEPDFFWAAKIIQKYGLHRKVAVLISPAFGLLNPEDLAEWMLELSLPIRLNLQLQKYIWDPDRRGV